MAPSNCLQIRTETHRKQMYIETSNLFHVEASVPIFISSARHWEQQKHQLSLMITQPPPAFVQAKPLPLLFLNT